MLCRVQLPTNTALLADQQCFAQSIVGRIGWKWHQAKPKADETGA
jgi:hypothetical protein